MARNGFEGFSASFDCPGPLICVSPKGFVAGLEKGVEETDDGDDANVFCLPDENGLKEVEEDVVVVELGASEGRLGGGGIPNKPVSEAENWNVFWFIHSKQCLLTVLPWLIRPKILGDPLNIEGFDLEGSMIRNVS